jgi:hypothetical protein
VLIPAVIRILESPEIPRKERVAPSAEKFPDVKPAESPRPAATSLNEVRSQLLESVAIKRPLLPDLALHSPPDGSSDYGSYLRALQQVTTPAKTHKVDVFE